MINILCVRCYNLGADRSDDLKHPVMEKIVRLKEMDYREGDQYDYAPHDFEDAMDNYDKVLEIIGSVCADLISTLRASMCLSIISTVRSSGLIKSETVIFFTSPR